MTFLIMKRAGHTFKGDKADEYGNPLALENMTDDQLKEWREIVQTLGAKSQLAELMLSQIDGEIRHRDTKRRITIGDI